MTFLLRNQRQSNEDWLANVLGFVVIALKATNRKARIQRALLVN